TEALLPEIERFAEIGAFIHQPVKTYSSGMYVRLAFSIAVSVSPQILIIDEALSVGDTIFQHRCIRRIKQMQESGTTVFFVSHDATIVRALCSRTILLNAGRMIADGPPLNVLNRYQQLIMSHERERSEAQEATAGAPSPPSPTVKRTNLPHSHRHGDGSAEILSAELLDTAERPVELVDSGDRVFIRLRTLFHKDVEKPVCGFMIRSRHGINIYGTNTEQRAVRLGAMRRGDVIETTFGFNCWLGQEHYFISVAVHSPEGISYDWLDGVIFFRVSCMIEMEGLANLNADVTTRRLEKAEESRGDLSRIET
ncbi:MAG: Wzt carbohydrate-binding domain-containing protein, partial [Acidobacteriota bacterium]|nr:Wzt carbohydrate-binding domain-containing protein [Acidobacteriota bacterium]